MSRRIITDTRLQAAKKQIKTIAERLEAKGETREDARVLAIVYAFTRPDNGPGLTEREVEGMWTFCFAQDEEPDVS